MISWRKEDVGRRERSVLLSFFRFVISFKSVDSRFQDCKGAGCAFLFLDNAKAGLLKIGLLRAIAA